ncbi:LysR family transcriptional regulator [Bosea sp. BK604]|uniref:LysR family transcriptional regulator n=1 Tax=Bosea sp. BK604 TaxID=2512180 RepID=UPI00104BCE2D|nr:LysR family transcriptional regulator [Bosea sp. BK604]TCR62619.1 DNA-binding transcriptional LysR family regulator [Bosea sp. BK604]
MARLDVNRSGEMEVFAKVVELGGFSAAARVFGMTPSAVSKLVARLEARLGTRLVNRSTRKLQLTLEGTGFYERSIRILADLDEAERSVAASERPVGRIRLNTNASYATHILMPVVPEFLARYPEVTLHIIQTDTVVDLMEESTDVAVRAGPLKSSNLIARKLGSTRITLVAAPAYLKRHGEPKSIADLDRHNRLGFCYTRAIEGWPLLRGGEQVIIPIAGNARTSDGEALRHLAIAGGGIARLAAFTVRDDIKAGRLVPILEELNPGDLEPFHAVYLGQGGPLPSRVRALLDFLGEKGRVG